MRSLKLTNMVNSEALTPDVLSILLWNDERLLYTYDAENEYKMLEEEYNELQEATKTNDIHEIIDAYCDIFVVYTGAKYKAQLNNIDVTTTLKEHDKWFNICENIEASLYAYGYDFKKCIQEALNEIFSRTGSVNIDTGKWEKDKSKEAQASWYKADYTKCLYNNKHTAKSTKNVIIKDNSDDVDTYSSTSFDNIYYSSAIYDNSSSDSNSDSNSDSSSDSNTD